MVLLLIYQILIMQAPDRHAVHNLPAFRWLQEMEHILDHIKSSRVTLNTQPDEFDHQHGSPSPDDSPTTEEAADDDADEQPRKPRKQKRLQTMVFSATLTLPQRLRSRFKKGLLLPLLFL